MPIVTSEILQDQAAPSGKRLLLFRYVDHLGEEYFVRLNVDAGFDANAALAQKATTIETNLPLTEVKRAIAVADNGQNPDKAPPDHQPQADFDRRLIAALMQSEDIGQLVSSLDFWVAHQSRSGNNNNARADTLGVPRPEYADVADRFGDMQGIAGGWNTVKSKTWDDIPSGGWT